MLRAIPVSLVVLLSSVTSLHAGEGVLEINQACAVNPVTGCFSGDAPGFPVTIDGSAGRSYLLTGDLVIPDPDTSGISISASGRFTRSEGLRDHRRGLRRCHNQ